MRDRISESIMAEAGEIVDKIFDLAGVVIDANNFRIYTEAQRAVAESIKRVELDAIDSSVKFFFDALNTPKSASDYINRR